MLEDRFRAWLITKAKYSDRSAKDVLSRCRRVERAFKINLDKVLRTKEGLERVNAPPLQAGHLRNYRKIFERYLSP